MGPLFPKLLPVGTLANGISFFTSGCCCGLGSAQEPSWVTGLPGGMVSSHNKSPSPVSASSSGRFGVAEADALGRLRWCLKSSSVLSSWSWSLATSNLRPPPLAFDADEGDNTSLSSSSPSASSSSSSFSSSLPSSSSVVASPAFLLPLFFSASVNCFCPLLKSGPFSPASKAAFPFFTLPSWSG